MGSFALSLASGSVSSLHSDNQDVSDGGEGDDAEMGDEASAGQLQAPVHNRPLAPPSLYWGSFIFQFRDGKGNRKDKWICCCPNHDDALSGHSQSCTRSFTIESGAADGPSSTAGLLSLKHWAVLGGNAAGHCRHLINIL